MKKDTIKYKEKIIKNWPNISLAKIDDINSIGWRDTNTKQKKAIFLLFLIKKDILYIKKADKITTKELKLETTRTFSPPK